MRMDQRLDVYAAIVVCWGSIRMSVWLIMLIDLYRDEGTLSVFDSEEQKMNRAVEEEEIIVFLLDQCAPFDIFLKKLIGFTSPRAVDRRSTSTASLSLTSFSTSFSKILIFLEKFDC